MYLCVVRGACVLVRECVCGVKLWFICTCVRVIVVCWWYMFEACLFVVCVYMWACVLMFEVLEVCV